MKFFYALTALFCLITISACSSGLTKTQRNDLIKPPRPTERVTEYSKALDRFSAMLVAYNEPEIPIYLVGKTVQNKTACQSLPMDISQMVASAVNNLGGNINFFPDMQMFLEFMRLHMNSPAGQSFFELVNNYQNPVYVIDGAITECDENKDVIEKDFNLDLTGTHHGQEGTVGGAKGWTANLTGLALDFHLVNYRSGFMIPRIQSSMAVDIKTMKGGYNFNIQVLGSGFGLNRSRKMAQGKHRAIRALVDTSILKLLGQKFLVPYWRCLGGMQPDKLVIRSLEQRFMYWPEKQRIGYVQVILQRYDDYHDVQVTGEMDSQTRAAIINFATKNNLPAMVSPQLYSHLYVNMPVDFSRPASIIFPPVQQPETAESEQQESAPVPSQQADANASTSASQAPVPAPSAVAAPQPGQPALGLQTAIIYRPGKLGETVLISGGKLKSGDKYKVVVEPEQKCYLYVFQRDSGGRLFPLFPRSDRTDGLTNPVQGKKAYEFPGGKGRYFYLDQRKGEELIYFYSTSKPDAILEKAVQQLNQRLPKQQKMQIENEVLAYLMSKETVTATDTGKSVELHGSHSQQSIRMNRVTRLDRNKLYVFPFKHQ